jgi:hypothetical protein
LLLFRALPPKSPAGLIVGPPRALLVFLVGETATAGLHRGAFRRSLRLVERFQDCRKSQEIQILGPYFSGSQASLQAVLHGWANEQRHPENPPSVHFISGAATGIDQERLKSMCKPANVRFQATVVPEYVVVNTLLKYLQLADMDDTTHEIRAFKDGFAILYESNTRYGQQAALGQQVALGLRATFGLSVSARERNEPTLFAFPLHISDVRAAYDRSTGAPRDDSLHLPSFGTRLRLPLEQSSNPRETEPSLTPTMTAALSERTLTNLLSCITHEHFRYALILATDFKDQLFLASLIRKHCPECRLIFSNSDLLFSHPDFSGDLRGSVVGSSYPLYSKNQRWSFPFRGRKERILLSGQSEYGYYNAMIALLDLEGIQSAELVEYGPPFPDPGDPGRNRPVPPVWISIIGQGGLYPVDAVPCGGDDAYKGYVFEPSMPTSKSASSGDAKSTFDPHYTALWIFPLVGMTLVLFYVGLTYASAVGAGRVVRRWARAALSYVGWASASAVARDRPAVAADASAVARDRPAAAADAMWDDWSLRSLFRARRKRLRWGQRFYVSVCLASLLAVYAYLALVRLIPLGHLLWVRASPVDVKTWNWPAPLVMAGLLGVFLLLVVVRAVYLPVKAWRMRTRGRPTPSVSADASNAAAEGAAGEQGQTTSAPAGAPSATGGLYLGLLALWRHRVALLCIGLLALLASYFVAQHARYPEAEGPGACLLFVERAASLANGVSPLVPATLLGLAFYCWGYIHLKRLFLLDRCAKMKPFPSGKEARETEWFERIASCRTRLDRDLHAPRWAGQTTVGLISLLVLFCAFCRIANHFGPSLDGIWIEAPLLVGLAGLGVLIVFTGLYLRKVWRTLRKLLQAVALLPLREAFDHIPTAIRQMYGPYLLSERPGRRRHLAYRRQQYQLLVEEYQGIRPALVSAADLTAELRTRLDEALPEPPAGRVHQARPDELAQAACACLLLLQHIWSNAARTERLLEEPPPKGQGGAAPDAAVTVILCPREPGDALKPVRKWLTRARDFVAPEITSYLSQFFVHLRNLALFLSLAPLMLLWAVSSYPFQPQRLWLLLAMGLLGFATLSIIWTIIQLERDELVSRILQTEPNRLNFHWGFLSNLALYAIPLLGLVVAASGDVSDLVHSLVDPLLQVLK